ncbi:MAG: hypothetical protein VB861_07195 [Planctomycetaceae bacterium]
MCDWIGNTEAVASRHFLQVTEDHFAKALQHPAVLPRRGSLRFARSDPGCKRAWPPPALARGKLYVRDLERITCIDIAR